MIAVPAASRWVLLVFLFASTAFVLQGCEGSSKPKADAAADAESADTDSKEATPAALSDAGSKEAAEGVADHKKGTMPDDEDGPGSKFDNEDAVQPGAKETNNVNEEQPEANQENKEQTGTKEQPEASGLLQNDAKFQALARERQRVKHLSDDLDRQMQEQFAVLFESDEEVKAAALLSMDEAESSATEDEHFAELEQMTNNVVQYFQQIKQLKEARDKARAETDAAVKEATVAAQRQQSSLQRQHLAGVMASSAVEMAKIEGAAADVMAGLDQLAEWKKRDDDSPKSLAEAVKVKAKLAAAVQFLKEHEGVVEKRADQINALMKEANMDHLL